jgi:hypothetical protein
MWKAGKESVSGVGRGTLSPVLSLSGLFFGAAVSRFDGKATYDTCPAMGKVDFRNHHGNNHLACRKRDLLHDEAFFVPIVCLNWDYPELSLERVAKTRVIQFVI